MEVDGAQRDLRQSDAGNNQLGRNQNWNQSDWSQSLFYWTGNQRHFKAQRRGFHSDTLEQNFLLLSPTVSWDQAKEAAGVPAVPML